MTDIERWQGDARRRSRTTAWRDLVFTVATAPGPTVAGQTPRVWRRFRQTSPRPVPTPPGSFPRPSISPTLRTRRRWTPNGASGLGMPRTGHSAPACRRISRRAPSSRSPSSRPGPAERPVVVFPPPAGRPWPTTGFSGSSGGMPANREHEDEAVRNRRPRRSYGRRCTCSQLRFARDRDSAINASPRLSQFSLTSCCPSSGRFP